jgi:hypothetical protein
MNGDRVYLTKDDIAPFQERYLAILGDHDEMLPEHIQEVRVLYTGLFEKSLCYGTPASVKAQHAVLTPLADYLGSKSPQRANTRWSKDMVLLLEKFARTGVAPDEDGGDLTLGGDDAREEEEEEKSARAAAAAAANHGVVFADDTAAAAAALKALPASLLTLLAGNGSLTGTGRVPSEARGARNGRRSSASSSASLRDPVPLSRAGGGEEATFSTMTGGGADEDEEPTRPFVSGASGLLVSGGPTQVAEILGNKGYQEGLTHAAPGMEGMQSLFFLRWLSSSHATVVSWVRAKGWKNDLRKAEALVLATVVDTLGREAGGHEHTVGTASLEILVRRLQGLCMLESNTRQLGALNNSEWLRSFVIMDGAEPIGSGALRDLQKVNTQIHGAQKGGGGRE